MLLFQINWSNLTYSVDDFGRTVYSFPIHIRIMIGVTLLFVLIILALLGIILGSRIYKTNRGIRKEKLKKKYQPILRELLFSDDESKIMPDELIKSFDSKDLNVSISRETISDELIHLHENFTGQTATRLEHIYKHLGLHKDSLRKLNNKKWYVVAKGMRELARMSVHEGYNFIFPFLNDTNEVLRMEARIAMMKLSEGNPLSFLTNENVILTDWDTANIYSMLLKLPEHQRPDFRQWLGSENNDVNLFCIRMIGVFRQQNGLQMLIDILDLPNLRDNIKKAVLKAVREMNAQAAEQKLLLLFMQETAELKLDILRTLEVMGSEQSASLMEEIIQAEPIDITMAVQATRTLIKISAKGRLFIEQVLENATPQLELIILHAKDSRL